jgi:hypothetical protein
MTTDTTTYLADAIRDGFLIDISEAARNQGDHQRRGTWRQRKDRLHGAILRVTVDISPILAQAITGRSQGVRDSATASPTVAAITAISTAARRQKAQALPASSAGSVERRCHQPIPTNDANATALANTTAP